MTKKILLITGVVVMIGIAVFLVWGAKPQSENGEDVGFSIRDFLPFGESPSNNTDNSNIPDDTEATPSVTDTEVPRLRKISSEPVGGAVVFDNGSTTIVRFVEKGTGNVYEARSDTNTIERLTNTTIPKVLRATWLPNGSGFLAQTLIPESELIETSLVKLVKTAATSSSETLTPFSTVISQLQTGIKEITVKPDSSKIFYYVINGSASNWFVGNPDGTAATVVNSHPLTEWVPKWLSGNTVTMQTKASVQSTGFAYSFDTQNKVLRKIEIALSGLSLNQKADGSKALVSNGGSTPTIFVFDPKTVSLTQTRFNTLSEKCVWSVKENSAVYCAVPDRLSVGSYPDSWYKGLANTEDSIRHIDLNNDVDYTVSYLSEESGEKIDVIYPSLSPNETHLIFRNKLDGYLWLLRVGD